MDIRVTQRFEASADRVFDAWINPEIARRWLFATASRPLARVKIDARAGRPFTLESREGGNPVAWTGRYLEVVKPRRLVFAYSDSARPRDTARIRVEIAPREKGCELTLVHEGAAPEDAARIDGRWAGLLYGLGETLASTSRQPPARTK